MPNGYNPGFDPDGNPKPWPVDDEGNDVPFCSIDNPQAILLAFKLAEIFNSRIEEMFEPEKSNLANT